MVSARKIVITLSCGLFISACTLSPTPPISTSGALVSEAALLADLEHYSMPFETLYIGETAESPPPSDIVSVFATPEALIAHMIQHSFPKPALDQAMFSVEKFPTARSAFLVFQSSGIPEGSESRITSVVSRGSDTAVTVQTWKRDVQAPTRSRTHVGRLADSVSMSTQLTNNVSCIAQPQTSVPQASASQQPSGFLRLSTTGDSTCMPGFAVWRAIMNPFIGRELIERQLSHMTAGSQIDQQKTELSTVGQVRAKYPAITIPFHTDNSLVWLSELSGQIRNRGSLSGGDQVKRRVAIVFSIEAPLMIGSVEEI